MGVKSTVTITREEANDLYAELRLKADNNEKILKHEASLMNTEELENRICELEKPLLLKGNKKISGSMSGNTGVIKD